MSLDCRQPGAHHTSPNALNCSAQDFQKIIGATRHLRGSHVQKCTPSMCYCSSKGDCGLIKLSSSRGCLRKGHLGHANLLRSVSSMMMVRTEEDRGLQDCETLRLGRMPQTPVQNSVCILPSLVFSQSFGCFQLLAPGCSRPSCVTCGTIGSFGVPNSAGKCCNLAGRSQPAHEPA